MIGDCTGDLMLIRVDTSDTLRICTVWAAIGLIVVPARLTGVTSAIASSSEVSFFTRQSPRTTNELMPSGSYSIPVHILQMPNISVLSVYTTACPCLTASAKGTGSAANEIARPSELLRSHVNLSYVFHGYVRWPEEREGRVFVE